MSDPETATLYRIENPNIPKTHDPNVSLGSLTSHPEVVGQWFDPDLNYTTNYLKKSTQIFGKDAHPVEGAQLVVAKVPKDQLDAYRAVNHPIASQMDMESSNYIIPRDGSVSIEVIPLDPLIEDLRGKLGNFHLLMEARERINKLVEELGHSALV